jgi:hypothetical protein
MMDAPEFLKTRRAAIAALAVAVSFAFLLVIAPLAGAFSAQNAEIAESLQQLGQFRAEQALRPALEKELDALNRQGASVPGIISADSTALAQAQLQSEIKTAVEASQGTVASIQALPASTRNGYEVIALQCDFSVPENRLQDLTYAIAAHRPYLFIDDASIAGPPGGFEAQDTKTQPILTVRISVHGFRWVRRK